MDEVRLIIAGIVLIVLSPLLMWGLLKSLRGKGKGNEL